MSRATLLGFTVGFGIPAAVAAARHALRAATTRPAPPRPADSAGIPTAAERAAAVRDALAFVTAVRNHDIAATTDICARTTPSSLVHGLTALVVHHAALVAHHEHTTTDVVLQRTGLRVARIGDTAR